MHLIRDKRIARYGRVMAVTVTRKADALGLERGDWIQLSIIGVTFAGANGT